MIVQISPYQHVLRVNREFHFQETELNPRLHGRQTWTGVQDVCVNRVLSASSNINSRSQQSVYKHGLICLRSGVAIKHSPDRIMVLSSVLFGALTVVRSLYN